MNTVTAAESRELAEAKEIIKSLELMVKETTFEGLSKDELTGETDEWGWQRFKEFQDGLLEKLSRLSSRIENVLEPESEEEEEDEIYMSEEAEDQMVTTAYYRSYKARGC
jgi:hypothetical protein